MHTVNERAIANTIIGQRNVRYRTYEAITAHLNSWRVRAFFDRSLEKPITKVGSEELQNLLGKKVLEWAQNGTLAFLDNQPSLHFDLIARPSTPVTATEIGRLLTVINVEVLHKPSTVDIAAIHRQLNRYTPQRLTGAISTELVSFSLITYDPVNPRPVLNQHVLMRQWKYQYPNVAPAVPSLFESITYAYFGYSSLVPGNMTRSILHYNMRRRIQSGFIAPQLSIGENGASLGLTPYNNQTTAPFCAVLR